MAHDVASQLIIQPLPGGLVDATQRALPHDVHMPSQFFELCNNPGVTSAISLNLCFPEFRTGFWETVEVTHMPVPEAAVNQDNGTVLWQHDIRSPWEPCPSKSIAQPPAMQSVAYSQLDFRVRASNA